MKGSPSRGFRDLPIGWRPPPPRRWMPAAVALGVAGDTLLRAEPGAGLALWLAALVGTGAALARAHGPLGGGREAVVGLGVAAAATLAVRSAPPLQVLAIGLVGVSVGWSLLERPWASGLTARLATLATVALSAVALAPAGALAGPRDVGPAGGWTRRAAVAARGLLAATPVLLVVGALFVAGDPVFAGYADRVLRAGLDVVLSHLALVLVLTWVAGGLVYAVAAVRVGDLAPPAGRLEVFAAEAIVALALLDLLFAVFLGVQARALFGGRAFVEATAGMTYAEYARGGFFQLAIASMIALPTVLVADWIVTPASAHRRAFVGAAWVLAAGVVLVLASAAHRMGLYVEAYGLTEARLYASALMGWLAIAAVWLAATIAGDRVERFGAGALTAGWAVFLVLVAMNPAALVVRVNAGRATEPGKPGFDVRYGAFELGVDAIPSLVEAVPRLPAEDGCRVARYLADAGKRRLEKDPRSWTISRWRARRALEAGAGSLRATLAGCPAEPAPRSRVPAPPERGGTTPRSGPAGDGGSPPTAPIGEGPRLPTVPGWGRPA